jgi:hypothetical protein
MAMAAMRWQAAEIANLEAEARALRQHMGNSDGQAVAIGAEAAAGLQMGCQSGSTSGERGVEEAELCVVCLDAPKTHLLVPCGHQCVCLGQTLTLPLTLLVTLTPTQAAPSSLQKGPALFAAPCAPRM